MCGKPKGSLYVEAGIPLTILLVGTLLFRLTNLDMSIAARFYAADSGWIYKDAQPWRALYEFGPIPAIGLTIIALIGLLGSLWRQTWRPYRRACWFIVILMLLCPILLVNVVFKEHWGRPRPRSIAEFGGPLRFHAIWEKGVAGDGHSFPSGHATMGFFLMAPYFLLRRSMQARARGCLVFGVMLGLSIGMARMVQGGHFASDILWAGGFVYFCALGLAYALGFSSDRADLRALTAPDRRHTALWGR